MQHIKGPGQRNVCLDMWVCSLKWIACAMQEAQRDTISAFEEYMDACMMSDWAAEKKALFDSALPDTALPGPAGQLAAASITAPYSPPQFRTPLPTGMCWPV